MPTGICFALGNDNPTGWSGSGVRVNNEFGFVDWDINTDSSGAPGPSAIHDFEISSGEIVALSFNNVQSGTYAPFSVGAWGHAKDGGAIFPIQLFLTAYRS